MEKKTKVLRVAPVWVTVEAAGPSLSCRRCGETRALRIPRPAAEVQRLIDRFVAGHQDCLERPSGA